MTMIGEETQGGRKSLSGVQSGSCLHCDWRNKVDVQLVIGGFDICQTTFAPLEVRRFAIWDAGSKQVVDRRGWPSSMGVGNSGDVTK